MKMKKEKLLFNLLILIFTGLAPECYSDELNKDNSTEKKQEQSLSLEERVGRLENKLVAIGDIIKPNNTDNTEEKSDNKISGNVSRGRQLFMQNCAKCHGATGVGNGPFSRAIKNIQDLRAPIMADKSNKEIFDAITNGIGQMPQYGNTLSEQDRWNIVKFVRTLQQ